MVMVSGTNTAIVDISKAGTVSSPRWAYFIIIIVVVMVSTSVSIFNASHFITKIKESVTDT